MHFLILKQSLSIYFIFCSSVRSSVVTVPPTVEKTWYRSQQPADAKGADL